MCYLTRPVEWILNKSKRLRKIMKHFQKIPHRVRNQKKQTECNSDSKLPRTNTNKAKYLNYRSGKPNPMNRLVRFPNQSSRLRKASKLVITFLTDSGIQQDKRNTIPTLNDQEPTQTKKSTQIALLENLTQ